MDAPILRFSLIMLSLFISTGATYQTRNFTVTAPTAEFAEQVGKAAEIYRRDLAIFWLGQSLPNWSRPCKLRVRPGAIGAGGETKFQFSGGEVLNWTRYVQGSKDRILDSVLPHEVNHTIFACHFRRPLPRWADEGAATLFEHRSEQLKQLGLLNQVIDGGRDFISLRNLLTMKEYPQAYRPMLILYAEGYALVDFLLQQGGRKRYLKFLADGERMGWTEAIKANYHHGGVDALQKNWQAWVVAGMPRLDEPKDEMLAARLPSEGLRKYHPTILKEFVAAATLRAQSPDQPTDRTPSSGALNSGALNSSTPTQVATHTQPGRQPVQPESRVPSPEVKAAGHAGPATSVFVGLPASKGYRDASFEAPKPKPATTIRQPNPSPEAARRHSSSGRFYGLRQATSDPPAGLERTNDSQSRDLPQERNVVTGSTPQWAGFPGQTELF